ncbi:hypothetical protein JTB14_015664 [Gonioctena quinquepunctata]|nr:hypothetical protein JTB14_015664 [Gonioctena quinquepunctata]
METPPACPIQGISSKTNQEQIFKQSFSPNPTTKNPRQPINTEGKPAAEEENVFKFDKPNKKGNLEWKPPKKSKNYKLLQAERKIEKEKQATRLSFQQLVKINWENECLKGRVSQEAGEKGISSAFMEEFR